MLKYVLLTLQTKSPCGNSVNVHVQSSSFSFFDIEIAWAKAALEEVAMSEAPIEAYSPLM